MKQESKRETEAVRRDWAGRGQAWDKRADDVAEMSSRMNAPMLEAAALAPGMRVLDLASGAGEPLLSVAEAVGEDGRVTALDLADEMLSGARRRAQAAGLQNIDFRTGDMQALDEPDATYDRVTCRFGIMFCPEPALAAGEAHRVLKPGGRAVYLVWGPRENTTMFPIFAEAARQVFGSDDPDIDLVRPFSLGADGALRGALEAGGFGHVEERAMQMETRIPAGKPFWLPQRDMTFAVKLSKASAQEVAALDEAIAAGFAAILDGDAYPMTGHVRLGVGIKAG